MKTTKAKLDKRFEIRIAFQAYLAANPRIFTDQSLVSDLTDKKYKL